MLFYVHLIEYELSGSAEMLFLRWIQTRCQSHKIRAYKGMKISFQYRRAWSVYIPKKANFSTTILQWRCQKCIYINLLNQINVHRYVCEELWNESFVFIKKKNFGFISPEMLEYHRILFRGFNYILSKLYSRAVALYWI